MKKTSVKPLHAVISSHCKSTLTHCEYHGSEFTLTEEPPMRGDYINFKHRNKKTLNAHHKDVLITSKRVQSQVHTNLITVELHR